MRLAAIYIRKHDYLFDEPQTINLGGKYFYEFKLDEDNKLEVRRAENEKYIDNFWGENISLVSAIVGENGVGKTSLLKELVMSFDKFREGTLFDNIACVYEINDITFKVDTKLDLANQEIIEKFHELHIEYYNPVLDYDLQDISGYINPSNIFENTLEEYHLNILKNQVLFNYSSVSDSLKNLYKDDFPKFGNVLLRAKLHYKQDFEKIFALSNLQEGMTKYLKKVFEKYPNYDSNKEQFIHNQNNFVKDIEATILSILVINNLYNVGSGSGISKYSIDDLFSGDDFLEILAKFKKQYILLNSIPEILERFENSSSFDFQTYLLESSKINNYQTYTKNILRILRMFRAFENFYERLLIMAEKSGFNNYNNNLLFSNSENNKSVTKNMVRFINIYSRLLKQLNLLHVKNPSLIEFTFFEPTANNRLVLSNGEKTLLNLYSIIYNFTLNSQIKSNSWKNFIFLLDEADLGFHPEWKKRFINSIVNVFPEILGRIKTLESIQIIFTTHDPLTLSDIPNSNVVYLKKVNGKMKVLDNIEKPKKSFGANITDLLSNSFFINNGLIGDFAKEKIQNIINWLNSDVPDLKEKDVNKRIIEMIDEPILRRKLSEMYSNKFDENLELEMIEREIKLLEERKNILKKIK